MLAFAVPASANTATRPAPQTTRRAKPHTSAAALLARRRLTREIKRIWAGPYLRRGKTAVYIVDARSGEELYAVHQDEGMNPASNTKLVATAAALDVLGPRWRYRTSVYGPTPNGQGVVAGDVYLHGDFDGSLSPKNMESLADSIANRGIRRVEGDVLVGKGVRDGIAWPWVYIDIHGGDSPKEPPQVTVYPDSDFVHVNVTAHTSWYRRAWAHAKQPVVKTDADGRPYVEVTIAGAIRVHRRQRFKRWVPMRSVYTASVLRAALLARGVVVTGHVRRAAFKQYVSRSVLRREFLPVELASHLSKPLAKLICKINKTSDNILADMMTRTVGRKVFGTPRLKRGAEVLERWLDEHADVNRSPVVITTGSGLSYKTRISARQLVQTLRVAGGYDGDRSRELTAMYRDSLAIAGKDGTLRRRFHHTPVRGKLHGKTGTLSSVIALSGYLQGPDDRVLAFSILTNHTKRWLRWGVRRKHEKIVQAMERYLTAIAH